MILKPFNRLTDEPSIGETLSNQSLNQTNIIMNKQNITNGEQFHNFMLLVLTILIYLSSTVGRIKAL